MRGGGRLEGEWIEERDVVLLILLEDEATEVGVGCEGNIGLGGCAGRGIEVEDEVVGEVGGEDQGCAFDGNDDVGLDEAGDLVGIGWTQRWGDGALHGRKSDDQDGLGVVKGRGSVEAQVHGIVLREADGRDVLVLGGMEVAHDADDVDDGADVGGVETCAGGCGVTCLGDEVRGGAVERVDDGLAVAVVEDDLGAGLGEAGELGVDGLLEAGVVGLEGRVRARRSECL